MLPAVPHVPPTGHHLPLPLIVAPLVGIGLVELPNTNIRITIGTANCCAHNAVSDGDVLTIVSNMSRPRVRLYRSTETVRLDERHRTTRLGGLEEVSPRQFRLLFERRHPTIL